jgi:hypothetical protein
VQVKYGAAMNDVHSIIIRTTSSGTEYYTMVYTTENVTYRKNIQVAPVKSH